MSNKYICPQCGKEQLVLEDYNNVWGCKRMYCPVCGFDYTEEELKYTNDPTVLYDRVCYKYEKAKQGAIDATQRLASAASDFVKGNSTTDKLLEEIIAELKEIKHALLTTPPYFKTPDITCSSGEINLCSACAHYNSPIGQCERGVAGCKYEPDERERY